MNDPLAELRRRHAEAQRAAEPSWTVRMVAVICETCLAGWVVMVAWNHVAEPSVTYAQATLVVLAVRCLRRFT